LSNSALALKFFSVLKYILSFRIFERLALALKTEFILNFFKPGGGSPPPRTPMNLIQIPGSVFNLCSHCLIVADVYATSEPAYLFVWF